MMLQMLAVFAEFEHAAIDRISAAIERPAKEGRWFGGRPPFGYTVCAMSEKVERIGIEPVTSGLQTPKR
jgi:DNA invertase Pin-like site-specific DNA recombinase